MIKQYGWPGTVHVLDLASNCVAYPFFEGGQQHGHMGFGETGTHDGHESTNVFFPGIQEIGNSGMSLALDVPCPPVNIPSEVSQYCLGLAS